MSAQLADVAGLDDVDLEFELPAVTSIQARAITATLYDAASTVGRLRRHLPPGEYVAFLLGRLGGIVDSLDAMLQPAAAELVEAGHTVDEALAIVDNRRDELAHAMGEKER